MSASKKRLASMLLEMMPSIGAEMLYKTLIEIFDVADSNTVFSNASRSDTPPSVPAFSNASRSDTPPSVPAFSNISRSDTPCFQSVSDTLFWDVGFWDERKWG